MTGQAPTTPRPSRPPDASMTLLTEMMRQPLDPGYAAAAESRRRAGLPPSTGYRTPLIVIGAVLIGAMLAIGALSLRVPTTAAAQAKAQLVKEIEARRRQADDQTRRVEKLRADIDAAQAQALQLQRQGGLVDQLRKVEVAAGAVPVTGPGVTLTLDDAKSTGTDQGNGGVDPRNTEQADQGRVIARDLQIVTNGLWQAGAEAISINGERLTARAAIRFAGQAILVNYRPLTRPYVISVIGDPNSLPAEFAGTDGGSYLQSLTGNYGIRSSLKTASRLDLPGDPSLTVRVAKPARSAGGTATTSPKAPTSPTTTTNPETAP